MIFKIHDIGDMVSKSAYAEKRKSLVDFIAIILGTYIDYIDAKYSSKETQLELNSFNSLANWQSMYISNNAEAIGKNILAIAKASNSSNRNNVNYDDIRECLEKFLDEEKLYSPENSKDARQLSKAISILDNYDPDKANDKSKGESYTLYESKIGVIFDMFKTYIQNNSNELINMKNKTEYIVDNSDDEDGVRKKGRDINHIGAEETYDLNSLGGESANQQLNSEVLEMSAEENYRLDSIVNLPREFCNYFLDSESDKRSAKSQLSMMYNVYLKEDIKSRDSGYGGSFLIGKTIQMNDADLASLDELIDLDFINNPKEIANVRDILYQVIMNSPEEKKRILSDFFCLLVKGRYKMVTKQNPYLSNFDLFRTIKIMNLEDFKRAIESTKLIHDGYSEFILLKDYNINDIVRDNTKKVDKTSFKNSISQMPSVKKNALPQVILDRRLENFLENVVKFSAPCTALYDKELVEGVNRDTVTSDDIKLAMKLLGHFNDDVSFRERINEFGRIGDLLNWKIDVSVLDSSEVQAVTQAQLLSILNGTHKWDDNEILNSIRLANLWKIIKHVHDEIITLEDELGVPKISTTLFNFQTKHGVKVWNYGGYLIPKIEQNLNNFFVRIYGCPVTIVSRKLDKVKFNFAGQNYIATPEGIELEFMQASPIAKMMKRIMPNDETLSNALIGVDERYDTDSITSWLEPNLKKDKVKTKIKATKLAEEGLYGKEFLEGLSDLDTLI